MGKLRVLSGEDVCRILGEYDFVPVRQKGSHRVMQKSSDQGTISVPVPLHDSLRRGTLLSIIRQSGVPRAIFETEN